MLNNKTFTLTRIVAVMVMTGIYSHSLALAEDAHHPTESTARTDSNPAQTATPSAETNGAAQRPAQAPMMASGGMPMMAMMMSMMMGQTRAEMPGMDMADHVEGRLAFLRAELKITEAQSRVWNDFSTALRNNAKKLVDVRAAVVSPRGSTQNPTIADRLDQQERWYSARLDGIRSIKTSFTHLYNALSDEQKKSADELVPSHLGLASMPPSSAGMAPTSQPSMNQMPMGRSDMR